MSFVFKWAALVRNVVWVCGRVVGAGCSLVTTGDSARDIFRQKGTKATSQHRSSLYLIASVSDNSTGTVNSFFDTVKPGTAWR